MDFVGNTKPFLEILILNFFNSLDLNWPSILFVKFVAILNELMKLIQRVPLVSLIEESFYNFFSLPKLIYFRSNDFNQNL